MEKSKSVKILHDGKRSMRANEYSKTLTIINLIQSEICSVNLPVSQHSHSLMLGRSTNVSSLLGQIINHKNKILL